MNPRELFNVAMYGVRDGVHIDDSLADGEAIVVEEAGERVGANSPKKEAGILKELAIKGSQTPILPSAPTFMQVHIRSLSPFRTETRKSAPLTAQEPLMRFFHALNANSCDSQPGKHVFFLFLARDRG